MKHLPEVCVGPRNNLLNFRDDPDPIHNRFSGEDSVASVTLCCAVEV